MYNKKIRENVAHATEVRQKFNELVTNGQNKILKQLSSSWRKLSLLLSVAKKHEKKSYWVFNLENDYTARAPMNIYCAHSLSARVSVQTRKFVQLNPNCVGVKYTSIVLRDEGQDGACLCFDLLIGQKGF